MVFIAAAGFATASGSTLGELWENIRSATPAATIESLDIASVDYKAPLCRVTRKVATHLDPIVRRRLGRTHLLALEAVRAVTESSAWQQSPSERRAIVVGIGFGEVDYLEHAQSLFRDRPRRVSPNTVPILMASSVASHVARECDVGGPAMTASSACASGADAIGIAADQISLRRADVVLVIGVDSILTPQGTWFFRQLGALSATTDDSTISSRPFDRDRNGFVLGEGAAALLLTAEKPDTEIGKVLGYASRHGGDGLVAPNVSGMVSAMNASLVDAGLDPGDIVSINAHGTSTQLNDRTEAVSLRRVFSKVPPVTANKGATGHLLAASGILEAAIAARSATTGIIPPTAGTVVVDPELAVDVVTSTARIGRPGPVLSNSFGFGGQNTSLVIGPLSR